MCLNERTLTPFALPISLGIAQIGDTPLHKAAFTGHAAVVGQLLAAKASVDSKNDVRASTRKRRHRGLFFFCPPDAACELIDVVLCLNERTLTSFALPIPLGIAQYGNTPLHQAANEGHAEVVGQLLAAKASVDSKNIVRSSSRKRRHRGFFLFFFPVPPTQLAS